MDKILTAAGTTHGQKHREPVLTHNQDSYGIHTAGHLTTLVVSDGVSAATQSHRGSADMVDWMTQLLHAYADTDLTDARIWEAIAAEIARRIKDSASKSYLDFETAVLQTWTATIGAIALGPEYTVLGAFGNPRFYVNGELIAFDDADVERHQPACIAYLVVPTTLPDSELVFKLRVFATADIKNVAVASDGIDELVQWIDTRIPGGDGARVEPIEHFWEHEEFFTDPLALTRYLDTVARNVDKGNVLVGGKLQDDTTIAVARLEHNNEE